MPPSSLTPTRPREVSAELADDLLLALGSVPDPRRDGGRRHPMAYVLGVLVMSFTCAGFGSFAASAQWAAAASARLLLMLGAAPDPLTGAVVAPGEATLRRIATRMDNEAFEAVVAAPTARLVSADQGGPPWRSRSTARQCAAPRSPPRPAPHLASAATHHTPVVLAQRQIPGKTNEIPMVSTLLDDLRAAGHDPSRMVFTLDALHTQHATARLLHEAGAGYVLTVKGNQPGLLAAVSAQVSAANPAPVRARSRGHARTSERLIQVAPATGIDFPGAARILRVAGVHRRARRSADPQRSGYYKRPDATAEAIEDGWFRTGDLGRRDQDGWYHIVDRSKDMIIRSGYNVYPREIEEVLLTHPAVSLAAVIGVPDERNGEEVKAYVILEKGASVTPDELIAWGKEQMASYKYPRMVEVGVDLLFFRNHSWERLAVNVGIVLVFLAFYLRFLRRP